MNDCEQLQMWANALAEKHSAKRCVISLEYKDGSSLNFCGGDGYEHAKPFHAAAIYRAPPGGFGEPGQADKERPLAANDRDGPARVPKPGVV
jgi:hypothetical protein